MEFIEIIGNPRNTTEPIDLRRNLIYENPEQSMANARQWNPWKSPEINKIRQASTKSKEIYRYQWNPWISMKSMETNGYQWKSM